MTVTFWIHSWDRGDGHFIFGNIIRREGAYKTSFGEALNLIWTIGVDEWDTQVAIPKDMWQHVALTYDGEKRRVYLNGELVAEKGTQEPIPPSCEPLILFDKFTGLVDELSLYSKSLDPKEIRQNMNNGWR